MSNTNNIICVWKITAVFYKHKLLTGSGVLKLSSLIYKYILTESDNSQTYQYSAVVCRTYFF